MFNIEIKHTNKLLDKKPLRTYETRFLYTGFRRYDVETKRLSTVTYKDKSIFYEEVEFLGTTFPRVYSAESVRVVIYQENPRMWAEVLGVDDVHIFRQIAQQDVTIA